MKRMVLLSFAVLSLTAVVAHAQPGPPFPGMPGGPPPEGRMERHLKELDLDPQQSETVKAIIEAARQRRTETEGRLREAFDEMHELLEQDSPDEDAVLGQADKIGEIQLGAHKSMLQTLLAIRAELTPEQRAELKKKIDERLQHGPLILRHRRLPPPDENPDESDAP